MEGAGAVASSPLELQGIYDILDCFADEVDGWIRWKGGGSNDRPARRGKVRSLLRNLGVNLSFLV